MNEERMIQTNKIKPPWCHGFYLPFDRREMAALEYLRRVIHLPRGPRTRVHFHPGAQRGQRPDRVPDQDHRQAELGRAADRWAGHSQDCHDQQLHGRLQPRVPRLSDHELFLGYNPSPLPGRCSWFETGAGFTWIWPWRDVQVWFLNRTGVFVVYAQVHFFTWCLCWSVFAYRFVSVSSHPSSLTGSIFLFSLSLSSFEVKDWVCFVIEYITSCWLFLDFFFWGEGGFPHSGVLNQITCMHPSLQCTHSLTYSHFFITAIITGSVSYKTTSYQFTCSPYLHLFSKELMFVKVPQDAATSERAVKVTAFVCRGLWRATWTNEWAQHMDRLQARRWRCSLTTSTCPSSTSGATRLPTRLCASSWKTEGSTAWRSRGTSPPLPMFRWTVAWW